MVTGVRSMPPRSRVARPLQRSPESAAIPSERVTIASIDGWLLTIIVGLCAFGLVMVYSASEALGYLWMNNANYFFERQLVGLAIGAVGFVAAARVDYHRWQAATRALTIVMVAMLLLVIVPHLGTERYGARRWFSLGPLSLQPSAVATLIAIIVLARWLDARPELIRTIRGVRDYGVLLGGVLGLVVLERDLGSTMVLGSVGVVLLALAGARKRHLVMVVGLLASLAFLLIKFEAYRASRLANFRNPFADPLNTGFQSVQALYALGSGGLGGVGLGRSIQKYQWLPEAHTDFIFAIIGEELGFIGTLAVIVAFLLLTWRGVRAALRAPDGYGALLAGGITAWIGVEAFINIAAVTDVVPTTGIPLPFISYGGTSLAMTMVALGILCNVSARGRSSPRSLRHAHVDRWGRDGRAPDARSGPGPGAGRG